jgi:large subunit ribosomal protein L29
VEARRTHLRDLRALTEEELDGKANELKQELFNLRFQFVAGRTENPAKIKQTRREIARVRTIVREKDRGSDRKLEGGA